MKEMITMNQPTIKVTVSSLISFEWEIHTHQFWKTLLHGYYDTRADFNQACRDLAVETSERCDDYSCNVMTVNDAKQSLLEDRRNLPSDHAKPIRQAWEQVKAHTTGWIVLEQDYDTITVHHAETEEAAKNIERDAREAKGSDVLLIDIGGHRGPTQRTNIRATFTARATLTLPAFTPDEVGAKDVRLDEFQFEWTNYDTLPDWTDVRDYVAEYEDEEAITKEQYQAVAEAVWAEMNRVSEEE